jgi:hypothetical protein
MTTLSGKLVRDLDECITPARSGSCAQATQVAVAVAADHEPVTLTITRLVWRAPLRTLPRGAPSR